MSVSPPEFWRLLTESRLLTPDQRRQLEEEFNGSKGASQLTSAASLAEWLANRRIVSRYQARLLLAGRPGPFTFGEYRVHERIRQQPLLGCFNATHLPTGHPVMLEFLSAAQAGDRQRWTEIAQHARKATGIVHPHLHRCLDVVDLNSYKFLVWERLKGEAASQKLAASERLPIDLACSIIRQAARGLMRLHQFGRPHADLRPARMWVGEPGDVKLLMNAKSPPPAAPADWSSVGDEHPWRRRVDYLAPELSQPGAAPTESSDIYALGCSLYELLTGRPPFADQHAASVVHRHAAEGMAPLEPWGVPNELAQLVGHMLAKHPQQRVQQAAVVASQLDAYVRPEQQAIVPQTPPTLPAYEAAVRQQNEMLDRQSQPAAAPAAAPFPVVGRPVSRDAAAPVIATAGQNGEAARGPRPRKKKSTATLVYALTGAAFVAACVIVVMGINSLPEPSTPPSEVGQKDGADGPATGGGETVAAATSTQSPEVKPTSTPTSTGASQAPEYRVIEDDGQALWAPPTSQGPLDLNYVPPGARVFLAVRPAEMLASPEGERVLKALGPKFESARQQWEEAAGVKLEEIEQVIVGLHPNGGKMPRASFVVRLTNGEDNAALVSRFKGASEAASEDATYYASPTHAFFVPVDGGGKVFAMGDERDIQEMAAIGGAPPALNRDLARLLDASDTARHVNLLFVPRFLFGDGREILAGDFQKLRSPLEEFLGFDMAAALVNLHFDDTFYIEMRMYGSLSRRGATLAAEMRDKVAQIPGQIEDYSAAINPPPYWSKLANRFPQMMYFLHRQTRIGAVEDQAVVNAVLPGYAAHNLVAASELALASTPGAYTGIAAAPAAKSPTYETIEDVLQHKVTYAVPQDSLEFSMKNIETLIKEELPNLPFEFEIKISGPDLQLNGITRNQQIRDFEAADAPLSEVLTKLCMKANPVTTVEKPSEADQKLIWVVTPSEGGKDIILVTTRDAAATKGYTLPAPFVSE